MLSSRRDIVRTYSILYSIMITGIYDDNRVIIYYLPRRGAYIIVIMIVLLRAVDQLFLLRRKSRDIGSGHVLAAGR